jgi:hypothetical protein
MRLHEKILAIYPELSSYNFADSDIELRNDGNGDYIAKWEHPTLAQPTQEQLDAVEAGS